MNKKIDFSEIEFCYCGYYVQKLREIDYACYTV